MSSSTHEMLFGAVYLMNSIAAEGENLRTKVTTHA